MKSVSLLVLGIGNIGSKYDGTRHNIGFDCVDLLGRGESVTVQRFQHGGAFECTLGDTRVACLKPTTYVNLSGLAAREALDYYGLASDDMLVIVDDFHLPLGSIRFRGKGSAGGHNGLKSLIETCGENFARLRFGIGPLPENMSVVDFVLGLFTEEEKPLYAESIQRAAESVKFFANRGLSETMNRFNT